MWITFVGPVDKDERTVIKLWITVDKDERTVDKDERIVDKDERIVDNILSICAMPVCTTIKRNFLCCITTVAQQKMLQNPESSAVYCTILHKIARYIYCDIYCIHCESLYTDSSSTVASVFNCILYTI